ncbi:putative late blight resistance protein homolog R1A-10 [Salvia hispanica]|uniref:putative late blight resistance protein homolog R1A-10 n=1 Tax=Salvia hispanica TaxID=49212 RepID=UPI002009ADB1|nr:putative late blight resistance protein homolog R1A-10 [Salvia hispanica]
MAATAYASLVSLLNTMDQIQTHPTLSICFDNNQFQSLRDIVDFLVDFVENYSEAEEDLMKPIGDAAHEAEDVTEVEAADQICGRESSTMFLRVDKIIQEMISIKEKVIKFKEETPSITSMRPPPPPSSPSSSASYATKKTTMLGFDGYVAQLLEELTRNVPHRLILPIVGMGGIGKTTLAKNVYESSLTVFHFDVRVWVIVSQVYKATHMLSQALSCLGGSRNKIDDELGVELYKSLFGHRYLIVLDDIWSVEAWEKIQKFFPENGNGSRIVVTTRQQEVANYFGSTSLDVGFLDYENRWNLFCEVTFAQQDCPPQLERIAKNIVKKCRGLPLAIRVIGGLLGKAPRIQEYWKKIAKDKSLVMEYSGDGNKPINILYLSYKYLPVWLRSCFLYMGLFPDDHLIDVSRLIKLWIAEGFIKPTKSRSLEQVAESYIKELVDRNLVLVGELTEYKKVLRYYLHDLVRELCIKTAEKENFYCVQREIGGRRQFIFDERSASFYPQPQVSLTFKKPSVITPLILSGQREAPFKSRLLRVLVGDHDSSLNNSFRQVNLRYLSHHSLLSTPAIPGSISLCWSLQTLIVLGLDRVFVPCEIWKMPQLRHINIPVMNVPHPPPGDVFALHNLQTLKTVENLIFSEEVCARIPNIRELDIEYRMLEENVEGSLCFHFHNVGRLSKLESLSIRCWGKRYSDDPLENLKLPNSLTKLILGNCSIGWGCMTMIASLPHLQLLDLRGKAVVGTEWEFVNEEFRNLKHLIIYDCPNLRNCIADRTTFPVLETLHLENLYVLSDIPFDIGEIPTLEKLSVIKCSKSARMAAIKILEEQESFGNQALHVHIRSWRDEAHVRGLYESPNLHFI